MKLKDFKINLKNIFLASFFSFVIVALGWNQYLKTPSNLPTAKTIVVPSGASLTHIAHLLDDAKVVAGYKRFRLAVLSMGESKNLQAGEYEFTPQISLKEVVNKLAKGDVTKYSVTIPEGFTVMEIINKLNNIKNLEEELKVMPIEGTLFPDTYTYQMSDSKSSIIKRMKARMEKELAKAWEVRAENLPFRSPKELLILASIVEKETGTAGERAKVAGVFINRLRKGMKLQSDPTVIYGATNYKGDLTTRHLRETHPYNTYVHYGLPPTPIANSGQAALLATANPEEHNLFYFVADTNGGHVFATNHAQHLRNVENYLKIYRQKYGRK